MESWFVIITITLCIYALLRSIFTAFSWLWSSSSGDNYKHHHITKNKLPPGPPSIPLIGNLIWLRKPVSELEFVLRCLKTTYGPLITVKIGPLASIFIASHSLAHQALIQNGAIFADRPPPSPTLKILNRTDLSISSSAYGPTWRLLRRNLTNEVLNPTSIKSHSGSRRRVLSMLIQSLVNTKDHLVKLNDHFQYTMFCLLVFMCLGNKVEEGTIREIESIQRRVLIDFNWSNSLNYWPPRLSKILFPNRWNKLIQLRQDHDNLFIPLIRARLKYKKQLEKQDDEEFVAAYVDTLVDVQLPEENNRKLEEWEMASLCSKFLSAGTDTTFAALQWIMANLIKYPYIQAKLYQEIIGVVGPTPVPDQKQLEEEELQKMPYLKAVVLEGLRRHPPIHFILPRKVTKNVELGGYLIPKNVTVNFMAADMGWDSNVWEDPMDFRPERFLNDTTFDVTGSKEIKMMPFGAGRRMCPASALGLLHLQYFVANLIWYFEWAPRQGDQVDLSEKQEFTVVMKNPVCAHINPRFTVVQNK